MKIRLVTYAAAGVLTLGSVCASQPAFAADSPPGGSTTEKIPHVQTGRAVPIPQYVQGDGPWATPRPTSMVPKAPARVYGLGFCRGGVPDVSAVCLGLNQLLRLLRFGL